MQSRDLVETHRLVFSAKLYDHQGPIDRGGSYQPPPPPPLAKVAKYGKRARVKTVALRIPTHPPPSRFTISFQSNEIYRQSPAQNSSKPHLAPLIPAHGQAGQIGRPPVRLPVQSAAPWEKIGRLVSPSL